MSLIGSQGLGLGSAELAADTSGEEGGGTGPVTSIIAGAGISIAPGTGIGDVTVTNTEPDTSPTSDVSGLTFPIVLGHPQLTAANPVTLPGLDVTGNAELLNGFLLQGPPGSRTIDSPDISGASTINGSLDVSGGAVTFHAGSPVTMDDNFEAQNGFLLQGPPGSRTIDSPDISGSATLNTSPLSPTQIFTVANVAALAALVATNIPISSFAWVSTLGAYFQIQTTALATTATTVIAASGVAGARWVRLNWLNPVWQAQTAWSVNTSTGNDENAGTGGAPLKTLSEAARRLSFATCSATVVSLIGNVVAGDKPIWTFRCANAFGFTLSGTTTLLYSGSVTTATNISPAPTTTENNVADTAIPVSFTASGLLANGVQFSRTSDGAVFWAMLDKGTKTIRNSQPHTEFGTDVALANGDAYTASQLPSVLQMTFAETNADAVFVQNVLFPSAYVVNEQCFWFETCWFTSANICGGNFLENCAFQGNGKQLGTGSSSNAGPIYTGGMWRGSGAQNFVFQGCANGQIASRASFQGVALQSSTGSFILISNDIVFYDYSGASFPLLAAYWSTMLMSGGAFGGSNNTNLASADRMSQIAHTANPNWVAGSSTNTLTPIAASGTAATNVAGEVAGVTVVNVQQNGIYLTS